MRGWSEEARTEFVSELLDHRVDDQVASFAADDPSVAVKKAAVSGLMWTGSDAALTRVLESMDPQDFDDVACHNPDRMPPAFRPRAIAAMRKFVESAPHHSARLRIALHLIALGESRLDDLVKAVMTALSSDDMRNLGSHLIRPALEYLHKTDPVWTNEWVLLRIAEGDLYGHEEWLRSSLASPVTSSRHTCAASRPRTSRVRTSRA